MVKKKKKIFWIIAIISLIALLLVINYYVGFIDFKELFVAGDSIPSSGGISRPGGIKG